MSQHRAVPAQDTRSANMQLRRDRILDAAREIMAREGFEGLSIRDLARQAGVTTPTIYNLVGNKTEILRHVMADVFERFEQLQEKSDLSDPLANAEALINEIADLLSGEEEFYRAALVANDQLRRQEKRPVVDGLARAVKLSVNTCREANRLGLLKGNINAQQLGEHIYACYLMARQEWMNGSIDTETFRKQALLGTYIGLAADANDSWHDVLMKRIAALRS